MPDSTAAARELELDAAPGPRDACAVCGAHRRAVPLFRCWGKWYCRDRVECYQRTLHDHP